MLRSRAVPTACVLALAFGLLGCREKQISNYRIQKEEGPPSPAAATAAAPRDPSPAAPPPAAAPATTPSMASTPVTTAQGAGLTWTAPAHWVSKPATPMRRATYTVTGAGGTTGELAITAFPGSVGGNLANVNRWRGQLQLPPITDAELEKALSHHDMNGLHADVVDLKAASGADPQRVVGAIVPFGEATWFFKFGGPDSLVGKEKAAFMAFLQSVKAQTP